MPHRQAPTFPSASTEDYDKIWRYMELEQLLWLLQNKSLYFSRVDKFSDKFEGEFTDGTIKRLANIYQHQDGFFEEGFKNHLKMLDTVQKTSYVNCWHANSNESMAMWQQYSGTPVAIQSTLFRLSDSLGGIDIDRLETETLDITKARNANISITPVKYVDFEQFEMDKPQKTQKSLRFKQEWYSYENEIRAVVPAGVEKATGDSKTELEPHLYVEVDLNKLVENVVLAPGSQDWQYEVISKAVEKSGLSSDKVQPSKVDSDTPRKEWT